jgi:hypothetical protein
MRLPESASSHPDPRAREFVLVNRDRSGYTSVSPAPGFSSQFDFPFKLVRADAVLRAGFALGRESLRGTLPQWVPEGEQGRVHAEIT